MLKGNSKDITFEQLMAQAADVAKAQDAILLEKAKEKRKIEEAKRLKEEKAKKELERKEKELQRKKLEMEQRQQQLQQQKKQAIISNNNSTNNSRKPSTSINNNQQRQPRSIDSKTKSTSSKLSKTKKNVPIPLPIVEKKKPVHMSYEQLMEKAKEVSAPKKSIPSSTTTTPIKSTKEHDRPASLLMNKSNKEIKGSTKISTLPLSSSSSSSSSSSLYVKRPISTVNKSKPNDSSINPSMRVRDRVRLLHNTPLQQVQRIKRDRQSIEEIQRDIRHSKGKYSDNEEDNHDDQYRKKQKMDQRLMKSNNQNNRPMDSTSRMKSERPLSSHPSQRPYPPLQRQPIRMPFKRTIDPRRDIKRRSRYQVEDDEEDEEMDSFIVDDDEEEVDVGHRFNNDYSSEISKLFRYDRSKYANENIYSDDDMEADTSEVLREEKRSERLARREDQIEEQLELERQKRKLAKAKRK